ncbi:hypothetical protein IW262DRAFT_1291471 [Armillaria fumosa]|nr:hypothetical protein IW262DRAFT_1291471 [Armillaria fumosa]
MCRRHTTPTPASSSLPPSLVVVIAVGDIFALGTVSTQDSEESIQQHITFARLGSRVTIVGHIRQDGSILKMEAVLSMGNVNIALEYELGQRLAVILELDYLDGSAVKIVGGEIRLSIGLLRVNYRFTLTRRNDLRNAYLVIQAPTPQPPWIPGRFRHVRKFDAQSACCEPYATVGYLYPFPRVGDTMPNNERPHSLRQTKPGLLQPLSERVQLGQDSSFCAYPWPQHRGKHLMWSSRRESGPRRQSDSNGIKVDLEALPGLMVFGPMGNLHRQSRGATFDTSAKLGQAFCIIFNKRIHELLEVADCRVELAWAPGHTGIKGNERADELAKVNVNVGSRMQEHSPSNGSPDDEDSTEIDNRDIHV